VTPECDGSISLFNGKDLTGWTMLGKGAAEVKDGVLCVSGDTGEKACLCYAVRTFGEFTLVVEWTVADAQLDRESPVEFRRIEIQPPPAKAGEGRADW
jgi:hypothetical protein